VGSVYAEFLPSSSKKTTPRNFSPCGLGLDENQTILMERPERVYQWIADAGISVPEVLLVPLRTKDRVSSARYGSSLAREKFDHGRALRMILADDGLKKAPTSNKRSLAR